MGYKEPLAYMGFSGLGDIYWRDLNVMFLGM